MYIGISATWLNAVNKADEEKMRARSGKRMRWVAAE